MPSDCQCSSACSTEIRTVEKVLNNKQATKKLHRLEEEVDILKDENARLKRRLQRATTNKSKIVKDLKSRLDRM